MSSKTKIIVLHKKEIIYTAIFLILSALMIALLVMMFGPKKEKPSSGEPSKKDLERFVAGVYTTPIQLNDNSFDVQVTVDTNHINSIALINLSESTQTMYPLMEPVLEQLASQIYEKQSLDDIEYAKEQKYTSLLLLDAIQTALSKAMPA